jgi:two-component system response regulator DesR
MPTSAFSSRRFRLVRRGYLVKDAPADELAKAVHQVRSGHRYIDAQLALKLAFLSNDLTPKERQVLTLLMEGTSYASIAHQLGISRKTVNNLTARVRQRLGVTV